MLTLQNITKDYPAGEGTVHALRGVSLAFRKAEFVAILGHSGCGKTTLLNIIGGLDQYTSGDLIIGGKSTKRFTDADWDSYRNHSIGFVFQSYNLIPHQTVLQNVELALTLSGVSPAARRERAAAALSAVGLGDQLKKKPNQLSGGQMQRVAIARALVNNPEILLADEPTGALDSETSIQIMELLKEISKDRLVIMVTHNPDLARDYASRVVRLSDGQVIADTNPYAPAAQPEREGKEKRTSMRFLTALSLSLTNLMTKKGRTLLTAFAGSIGIIGIALILSLSNGIQTYIDKVQEDTLSSYPITIEAETTDYSGLISSMMEARGSVEGEAEHELDGVYSNSVMAEVVNAYFTAETQQNNLTRFKAWLEEEHSPIRPNLSAVRYTYDLDLSFFTRDVGGNVILSDASRLMASAMLGRRGLRSGGMGMGGTTWAEMLSGENGELVSPLLTEQYDLLYGRWPERYDEVVVVLSEHNELSDIALYALGLKDTSELGNLMRSIMDGEDVRFTQERWDYETLCAQPFKLILDGERYEYDSAAGTWHDISDTDAGTEFLYNAENVGIRLSIVGILRPNPDAVATMLSSTLCYTSALTDYVVEKTAALPAVAAQLESPETDIFSALPFRPENWEPTPAERDAELLAWAEGLSDAEKAEALAEALSTPAEAYLTEAVEAQMGDLTDAELREMLLGSYAAEMGLDEERIAAYFDQMDSESFRSMAEESLRTRLTAEYAALRRYELADYTEEEKAALLTDALRDPEGFTEEQRQWLYENRLPASLSDSTLEKNLSELGYVDLSTPRTISLYAATFAQKDAIAACIDRYNREAGEEDEISYTDYVALLMSSITTIINAISYVLIAFVAISLVVSSIMIGIITYISVLERTKEIGILRAIGASKRDIANVFNAETLIIGFASGALGILVTLLLTLPINFIIHTLTDIMSLNAILPPVGGVVLILISMLLTFIAGLIPSGLAAKKDPVVALRTE